MCSASPSMCWHKRMRVWITDTKVNKNVSHQLFDLYRDRDAESTWSNLICCIYFIGYSKIVPTLNCASPFGQVDEHQYFFLCICDLTFHDIFSSRVLHCFWFFSRSIYNSLKVSVALEMDAPKFSLVGKISNYIIYKTLFEPSSNFIIIIISNK